VSGATNPPYTGTFVFDNDHPCVGVSAPRELAPAAGIYRNSPATGVARVVCYSPRHDVTLAELDVDGVDALLATWQQQMRELAAHPDVRFVLIFENKGEVVGVSNPHPHGQIYATNFTFKYIETELAAGRRHLAETGHILFQDILAAERQDGRRIIAEHGSAIAFVPYFARYAYETYVAPLRSVATIDALDDGERRDLATVLRDMVIRFDNLWKMPFPYVMVLHQAPVHEDASGFHFHIEFHPPLRRPNLLKYLAGPEIGGGNFLSDTWPEDKAAELIAAGGPHYRSVSASTEP
jgi:UDPglucose--hexose-1-phosphate uridylyltransferase